ncbi:hypothetical protein SAMN05216524_11054 [Mucilaginibacter sp. OK098]|nr:hypothetical protein SAMN05216524_11054 [Mucilaginibacter sp. OK098]
MVLTIALIIITVFLFAMPIWALIVLIRYFSKGKAIRKFSKRDLIVIVLGVLSIIIYVSANVYYKQM